MVFGHGDDGFKYKDILYNFSSNVYQHADLTALKEFLSKHLEVIKAYPEPEPIGLEHQIAKQLGVAPQCVLVTNGATDAIYLIARALNTLGCIFYKVFNPTFSEYEDASIKSGLLPTTENEDHTVCWLCNPNNPDGFVYNPDEVNRLAATYHMLVVDQSYAFFTEESLMLPSQCVTEKNIIQIHSLTKKYAVPGLRIGYIVANSEIVQRLRAYMQPWAVNALAINAASFLIQHRCYCVKDISAYLSEARRLERALARIEGLQVKPSSTHFMLVRAEQLTAAELKEQLALHYKMLIRDASNFAGLDSHWFRIAAQDRPENDLLVKAVRDCLGI